jgi:hypothetical protein
MQSTRDRDVDTKTRSVGDAVCDARRHVGGLARAHVQRQRPHGRGDSIHILVYYPRLADFRGSSQGSNLHEAILQCCASHAQARQL